MSKEFQNEMKARSVLFTYRLPSFFPDFNPIEKLWRNTKKNATHLKYFKTFDDLRESVLAAFGKYMSDVWKIAVKSNPSKIPIITLPKARCSIDAHINGVPALTWAIKGKNARMISVTIILLLLMIFFTLSPNRSQILFFNTF